MDRIYQTVLRDHFSQGREALFLSGARQVGKTTISTSFQKDYETSAYLNWDNIDDRARMLSNDIPLLDMPYLANPLIIFDEIHKYKEWKNFLKGLFDKHKDHTDFLVTGSARLDTYRRGGDSMMGRYFLYRIHPFSVAELLTQKTSEQETRAPSKIDNDSWESLLNFGGFPRPLFAVNQRIYNRWATQRLERLFHEDIQDILRAYDIAKVEVLAALLSGQVGQQLNYTSLSKKVQVSDQTIRAWISTLESLYYCFTIKPYSTNVSKSLLKDPKVYLWDWSTIQDKGQKYENFIASHLLKAVHFWQDMGYGQYKLHYLRDTEKREVDFLITKNQKPWIMIEVKSSIKESLSKNLSHFQKQLNAPHVFQVAMEANYIEADCFSAHTPTIVPAKTLLSQLI